MYRCQGNQGRNCEQGQCRLYNHVRNGERHPQYSVRFQHATDGGQHMRENYCALMRPSIYGWVRKPGPKRTGHGGQIPSLTGAQYFNWKPNGAAYPCPHRELETPPDHPCADGDCGSGRPFVNGGGVAGVWAVRGGRSPGPADGSDRNSVSGIPCPCRGMTPATATSQETSCCGAIRLRMPQERSIR